MQDDPAGQLDVEVALFERALGRFANRRKRFDQQIVQFRPLLEALPKLCGAGGERLVRQLLELRLQLVDLRDERPKAFDVAVVGGTEQPPEDAVEHEGPQVA
jgi:hypothetical protein